MMMCGPCLSSFYSHDSQDLKTGQNSQIAEYFKTIPTPGSTTQHNSGYT